MGRDGPAHGSAKPGGSAEPILASSDEGFGVDVQDCIPMTIGGHFGQFPFHNRHNYLYIRTSPSHFTHTPQARVLPYSLNFSLVVSS
uniref:Uncharacterized protein n=1 Tax=Oryza sativa subsp. japonica TaxID=39947 RepID=Q6Z365_ORYSJ|nr:hypothetical protein [Oryza sativa Japonica Group]